MVSKNLDNSKESNEDKGIKGNKGNKGNKDNENEKKNKKKNQECVELKNIQYKSMLLNHQNSTVKTKPSEIDIEKYLKHESKLKTKLLWSKLDKSIKIKKLVDFASVWVNKNYTELSKKGDKISTIKEIEEVLTKYLKTALQRKKLSKNKEVEYDVENEVIVDIPGLEYKEKRNVFVIKSADKKNATMKNLTPVRRLKEKRNITKRKMKGKIKKDGKEMKKVSSIKGLKKGLKKD